MANVGKPTQKRAALLLQCYKVCLSSPDRVPTQQDVDEFHSTVQSSKHEELVEFVHNGINEQLEALLESVLSAETLDAVGNRRGPASMTSDDANTKRAASQESQLMSSVGFILCNRQSSIPNAGNGVFVKTTPGLSVVPGTVLSMYPGLVITREHLRSASVVDGLLPDPDFHLMSRYDQVLIDGRTSDQVPSNPYALGHAVNHPGSTQKPNVMQARKKEGKKL